MITSAWYGGHNGTVESGRYAHLEDEQRFVLGAVPQGAGGPRLIEDRYIRGTRLRLRRVTDGEHVLHKLGHKVPVGTARPSAVWHTTSYLDASEYEVLCALAAWPLAKRRWSLGPGTAVDELLGALEGLVLMEGDRPFDPPVRHLGEVTDDERFRGGALACLDASSARSLVAEVAGMQP
jgi:hypothetical protein